MSKPYPLSPLIAVLALLALQAGCAPPLLVAGAAAGTAGTVVVAEKRTPGIVFDDQGIESKARGALNSDKSLVDNVHVSVTSFNHVVLLTGQVPNEAARQRVIAHIRGVEKIKRIHDHLEIGSPTMLGQRSRDTITTARLKSDLMGENGLPSVHVKVVTENDVVYLMGLVKRSDAEQIAGIAQKIEGVKLIVLVFEYVR